MKYITLKQDMTSINSYSDKIFQQLLDENILNPDEFYYIPNDLFESQVSDLMFDGNKIYFKVVNEDNRIVDIDHYEPINYTIREPESENIDNKKASD